MEAIPRTSLSLPAPAAFALPAAAPARPSVGGLHPGSASSLSVSPETSAASSSSLSAAALVGLALVARSWGRSRRRAHVRSSALVARCGQAATVDAPATTEVSEGKAKALKSFFSDVLDVKEPQKLDTFLAVLQGSDYSILGQEEWKTIGGDLHPFILPVATRGAFDDDLEVVGLIIRAPNGKALRPDEFQVVSQKPRKSKYVQLIATDINMYVVKRAEEATFRKEKEDLSVVEVTKDVYDVRFQGKDQTALDKWLLLEVGAFPDVYKNLASEKIAAGDAKTGLVIADTMRESFGTSWAFPHAYVSNLLRKNFNGKEEEDRQVEANHCAMQCFTSGYPLWTLEDSDQSLYDLLCIAAMPKLSDLDSLRVFYLKRVSDDQRTAVRTGNISLGCAALAKAQALMDAVVCGHKSYNRIRQELMDLYDEVPGCEPLVDMIHYFKQPAEC